jgi:hypothetical protein
MTNRLADIASRVARLTVDRRDPEKFFVDRSELAAALRRLARTLPADESRPIAQDAADRPRRPR